MDVCRNTPPGGLVGASSDDVVRSRSSPSGAGTAARKEKLLGPCVGMYIPLCHVREGGSMSPADLVVSSEMTILGKAASISGRVDLGLGAGLSYPAGLPRRSLVSHGWLQLLTSPMVVVGIFPACGTW